MVPGSNHPVRFSKQVPNAIYQVHEQALRTYGGHYVPSVAHRFYQGDEAKEGLHINLKGIAIGNGLTNPLEQYQWYPAMAFDGGKSEGGTAPGVISNDTYNQETFFSSKGTFQVLENLRER